jgi:hypothetical protein
MSEARPPRLAEALIAFAVPADERDAVLGDLDEGYREQPRSRAALWYWAQAALFVAGYSLERTRRAIAHVGWRAELSMALRSHARRPAFALTCVLTLALGISLRLLSQRPPALPPRRARRRVQHGR